MNAVENEVQKLVQTELNSANEKFPLFPTAHHGYAIIKEECDETFEAVGNMQASIDRIWELVKSDKNTFPMIGTLKECAICAAIEAIQVAAMCDKYVMSLAGEENG